MTRRLLVMVMSLGLIVTAVGFTGIYAVLADRAKTGDFIVNSGERPTAVDLKIATTGVLGECDAEDFVEDVEGVQFSTAFVQPTGWTTGVPVCIWNAGSAGLEVHALATDVTDVDSDCTNDEADYDDGTCGGDQQGELAPVIDVGMWVLTGCDPASMSLSGSASVATLAAYEPQAGTFEGWDPGLLAPDEIRCMRISLSYPTIGDGTTETEAQLAQSDTLTWRIAFDGTLP